ncbi:para-nitrobenzyl esterase [Verticillium alfalfae VaMs.102]|uniref:Para-nitrobenzyl esterase n=1 Tax=Verticillium alfalfae (strain VaMs.102 / ATCC MYA-4576 / FGSC 10136) TaxID=526221 RepID=C9SES3_VERA1|nr:para-nitrobenzyl esterase [Verticillium alfalfae VaMs.102]EEY16666.1 para-nitrobenzyl esterase [Verticillium alfalfae VaMs.102]
MGLVNVFTKAASLAAVSCFFPSTAAAAATSVPSAVIPQGTIRGFRDTHGNSVFLGVPFAATTGGKNRGNLFSQQGEDCLNLNIWAPATGENLPVFVYMYGGAMVTGSSSDPQLQGTNFARNDVVYVNFNTRESIFASPYSSELDAANPGESQNFSILDVEKALDWVRENIKAFGGNPDHIVFGGHSSGSVQVDHYLWNHPDTWLKGAVEMSANALSGPGYAPQNEALDIVAAEVGCPAGGQGQVDCLRDVDLYAFQTANFNATSNTWFTPVIDDITRHSDYAARFAAGKYASHVPLLTGTSDGEGTIFSIVYGGQNTNFSSWINTFDADSQHIPDCNLISAYPASSFASESLRSGTQYGDARFTAPPTTLSTFRSNAQDTWVYRFFGAYDNVVGPPGTAPTHGTEVPFFHGGNECFEKLSGVTAAQQALADSIHGWFVQWIKNPAAGPGWDKAKPKSGPLVKLGVPADELSLIKGTTDEFNSRCQKVYNPRFNKYPVVQSVEGIL